MAEREWLERLGSATEYRDLQRILSEMGAESRSTTDGAALTKAIDQAVDRLMQERSRDEEELRAFEDEYGSFKDQKQGVLGWLKRHIPFSESRRQEKGHKQAIADQRAEILADGFMIARAQMIKEQLLPPEDRRMGRDEEHWRSTLNRYRSTDELSSLASEILLLSGEQTKARSFADELSQLIGAFAKADFSAKQDRDGRDADVMAARGDLQVMQGTIQERDKLRAAATSRLGELVEDEIRQGDPNYRSLSQRIALLTEAEAQFSTTRETAAEARKAMLSLVDLERRRHELPKQREELENKARRCESDLAAARRMLEQVASEMREQSDHYESAIRDAQQAESAVEAAKRLRDAHLREQGQAEHDPSKAASAIEVEFSRMQEQLRHAQDQLRRVSGPHDAVKKRHDEALAKLTTLQDNLDKTTQDHHKLAEEEQKLGRELTVALDQSRHLMDRLQALVRPLAEALRSLGETAKLPPLPATDVSSDFRDLGRGSHDFGLGRLPADGSRRLDELERFISEVQQLGDRIDRDLKSRRVEGRKTWEKRCRELLDASLATELCAQKE